jgi:RNA recognition motif-containing protein
MNIYVSNLSFDVNDSDLKELFEEFGKVSSAKVITDRMSGKSRGFGFVEMDDNTEGQKAIEELNQVEYDGKVINVSVAKPKTDRPGGNSGGGQRGGGGGGRFNSERRSNYRS